MKRIKKHFLDMFIPINKVEQYSRGERNYTLFRETIAIIGSLFLIKYYNENLIFIGVALLIIIFLDPITHYQEGSLCVIVNKYIIHLPFLGILKIIVMSKVFDVGYTNCMANVHFDKNSQSHVKEYIYISTIPVDLKILANLFIRHWKNRHIIIVPATEHNIEVLTKEYGFKINKKYRNKLTYENYGNYIYGKKQFEEIKKRPF